MSYAYEPTKAKRIGAAVLALAVLAVLFTGAFDAAVTEAAAYADDKGADTAEFLLGYGGALTVPGAVTGGTAFVVGAVAAGL